jgi:hypothetical protein
MESLVTLLGVLFFMFLVLAAAVEVILEMLRGALERFGITWTKSCVSVEDALALASAIAPEDKDLATKIQAVKSAAQQIHTPGHATLRALDMLHDKLAEHLNNRPTNAAEAWFDAKLSLMAGELNSLASSVKHKLDASESKRIFILRALAAVIGAVLVWRSGFYVFPLLSADPNASRWMANLDPHHVEQLRAPWINVLVGGLASAAGSSYWHDQLDKLRNLKSLGPGGGKA